MKSSLKFIALIIVALAFPSATVAGTKFEKCLASVQNGTYGVGVDIGGTDNSGHPVNVSVATGITYGLCLEACGGDQEPFQWSTFSQQFGVWLLPWLALVSQLPFGANDKLDNLTSVLLTVGSPTLAAYSLALTVLNSRWIAQQFAQYTYPNVRDAIHVLSSLQQSPIRVVKDSGLLASLIVLPENDKWWSELTERLGYTHTWSVSAATSIAWVVIAFVFTVVNSFTGDVTNSFDFIGQAVGSLWLWLLPIVIGWLQVSPKCDSARLRGALQRVNELAHLMGDDGKAVPAKTKTKARAIELAFTDRANDLPIELTLEEVNYLRRDEKCTAPIYNYARFRPWVQSVEDISEAFQAASDHFHNQLDEGPQTKDQVETYCTILSPEGGRRRSGPNVVFRMFIASTLALLLQWGTTGAAMIVVWFTPTQGLDCRSASYLLYAVLSTIVWILLVTSSILTHYALTKPRSPNPEGQAIRHDWTIRAAAKVSIWLRWLGKFIATFNTAWVVVLCLLQFGNFFNNCYCNSCVFWLRHHAYNVIALVPGDFAGMTKAWGGGLCLAGSAAAIYGLFVSLRINPPLPPACSRPGRDDSKETSSLASSS